MQATLRSTIKLQGTGLHSGRPARIQVHPAPPYSGVWFKRTDVTGVDPMIPARWDAVDDTRLCTRIANPDGATVSTIEHLMAALAGCGVLNALVEIDGPEVPILDGSAAPFVRAILARGIQQQDAEIHALRIRKPVTVQEGLASATLMPADTLEIAFEIDFPDAAIGRQTRSERMVNGTFVRTLCDSRTFCRSADVAAMQKAGLALGGTYENAIVVDGDAVLSPGGLRHADEPVRHKMLDALGDLALAGAPVIGRYQGVRAGHRLTNALLRAVFADPDAAHLIVCDEIQTRALPGVGVAAADIVRVA